MPTLTMKVSEETRRLWQQCADRECGGNVSEWIRRVCDPVAAEHDRLARATGSIVQDDKTYVLDRGQVGIVRNSRLTDRVSVVQARPPDDKQQRRLP